MNTKMSRRGRMVYIPGELLDEFEDIKINNGFKRSINAKIKAIEYIKVGKVFERVSNVFIPQRPRRRK